MKLTKPSLQDLKQVSVMIICSGTESKGSGTIVRVDDTLYVLTAAHVIEDCVDESISVLAEKDKKFYTFRCKKIVYFDLDKDCAVLQVSNDDSYPEESLRRVRILKQVPNGEGVLCGFDTDRQDIKVYPFTQVSDTSWFLMGFDVAQQPINAKANWGGFSGGGIFYKGEKGELFLSYYMKSLLKEIEGNNNEFVCYPAANFADFESLQNLLFDDRIEIEYVSDEGMMNLINHEVDKSLPHLLTSPPMIANTTNVIGREKDLQMLWEVLKDKKHVILTGFGGIGKTKLAQMLFHQFEAEFDEVAWIEYRGNMMDSFLASINAKRFSESNYGNDKVARWNAINSSLTNDGKTKLIIIDNVNGDTKQHPRQDMELKNLTGWKDTTVLLTSRLDRLGGFQKTELKELTEDGCIDLFYYYFGNTKPTREIVAKIVELANMHTFTIELLAKGAEREDLEKYYERLIEKGFGDVSRIVDAGLHLKETTIEKHLKTLFDMQNRSDEDKKVLNSFAALPEYCRCSMEEIQNWFGFGNADLDQVIRDGWLTYNEDDQRYYIHSLVRTIIRFDFLEDGQGKKAIAPEGTTDKILEYFSNVPKSSFDIGNGYLFLQRMIEISESVISAAVQKETEIMARIYHCLGFGYDDIGDYDKALEYYWKALKIKESRFGKDHLVTAETYHNIAVVYKDKGDYDEALKYYKDAMKIRESKLGENHPDTATTYNGIAVVYSAMEDYDSAHEYFDKAKEIREVKLGKNHLYTAKTYNNKASAYRDIGDYDNALRYYNKAKEIRELKLGKDNPSTATTYNNIAIVYSAKKDYDKAHKYFDMAKEIRESKLGKDHPYTATTYRNIAVMYKDEEDYNNALDYYLKALTVWLKRDIKHPNAKKYLEDLAVCYQESNKEKDFVEWLKERLNEKEWEAYLKLKGLL